MDVKDRQTALQSAKKKKASPWQLVKSLNVRIKRSPSGSADRLSDVPPRSPEFSALT